MREVRESKRKVCVCVCVALNQNDELKDAKLLRGKLLANSVNLLLRVVPLRI